MNRDSYARHYAKLYDEDLLRLKEQRSTLTDDAQFVLSAELEKRGLEKVSLREFQEKSEKQAVAEARNNRAQAWADAKNDRDYNIFFAVLLGVVAVIVLLAGARVGGWLIVGVLWFGVRALMASLKMRKTADGPKGE